MNFYRLIKPDWAKKYLANGEFNPKFVREITGNNTIEGCTFTEEFLHSKNKEGYNVYFFPNHPSTDVYSSGTNHLSGKNINVFNFVFVDMDLKDKVYASKEDFLSKLSQFELRPSIVVESGHGIHAYWNVNDLTRDSYVFMQMCLLNYFNTDESVYTVLQLMRAPGFYNTKNEHDFKLSKVLLDHSSNKSYSIKDFPKSIYRISEEQQLKVTNHLNRLDGKIEIQLDHDANIDELPDDFITIMGENDTVNSLFNRPKEYNGDRSSADMKLANILYNRNMSKKDSLRVIANTQKALEKSSHRYEYAQLTIDKVYVDRTKNKFLSVGDAILQNKNVELSPKVYGPYFMDYAVLDKPWRKKQILGLIAGSGVGKTAVALKIIKDMIQNNSTNDDVFVFVTLEMPVEEMYERWTNLVGKDSPMAYRLYVIGNEDDQGNSRNLGLQEIHSFCSDLVKSTGKNIGAIVVDHFRLISTHIDVTKRHTFGAISEPGYASNNIKNLSENKKADALKTLVKMLDTFLIILTQTTKEKGVGDLPIGKDGAFGTSSFENIVDRLITCWQPLMRVQHLTTRRFLAWQYTKNRHLGKNDKINLYDPKLLTYNMTTGELNISSEEEYQEFQRLLPQANSAREALIKKKVHEYSIQLDLRGIDDAINKLRIVK